MNTKNIKEVGKWMMVIGASLFTFGAGANMACVYIENKEAKAMHKNKLYQIEEEELVKEHKLKDEALAAATEKDRLYSEKLKTMDGKTFAKFHAENVAKANDAVIANANEIKKQAEADIVKVRLECNDAMNKLREECLRKVEEADKKRDDAIAKYEAIDALFTNKKEILKAKEALEAAVKDDKKAKENKEELLKSIEDILA